jgi:hypothetical protein
VARNLSLLLYPVNSAPLIEIWKTALLQKALLNTVLNGLYKALR